MFNCGIIPFVKKIYRILKRCQNMIKVKQSSRCILVQKKYEKQKRELPMSVPSCGILGIRISQTKIVSGRVNKQNEKSR